MLFRSVQKHQFFGTQPSSQSNSIYIYMCALKNYNAEMTDKGNLVHEVDRLIAIPGFVDSHWGILK